MLQPATGRRRRELTAAFQWRWPCRLHVDRIFKMQIVFFQMQPAFRSYYARMQPAYDGMQDAAGCMLPAGSLHAEGMHL